MAISRRDVLLGGAGAVGAASFSFPSPAIAQSEPIKIGFPAAMTGPSSAPRRGVKLTLIWLLSPRRSLNVDPVSSRRRRWLLDLFENPGWWREKRFWWWRSRRRDHRIFRRE